MTGIWSILLVSSALGTLFPSETSLVGLDFKVGSSVNHYFYSDKMMNFTDSWISFLSILRSHPVLLLFHGRQGGLLELDIYYLSHSPAVIPELVVFLVIFNLGTHNLVVIWGQENLFYPKFGVFSCYCFLVSL